jgi:hypothetical protein
MKPVQGLVQGDIFDEDERRIISLKMPRSSDAGFFTIKMEGSDGEGRIEERNLLGWGD